MPLRNLSTWLFSVSLLIVTVARGAAAQQPAFCLPPVFDGGQRLHELPAPSVSWLELVFRQHEMCWRTPAGSDELRVFLAGNSAIFGYPLRVEQTLGFLLNQDFAADHVPAHLFNLGMVATYQLKDAVVIHESLKYRPDVVIYPVTLSEFAHFAPSLWPSLVEFFESNRTAVLAFAQERPSGLAEPLDIYRDVLTRSEKPYTRLLRLRQIGSFIRTAVRQNAQRVLRRLAPDAPLPHVDTAGRQTTYDCAHTQHEIDAQYRGWQDWNIIAYLAQIRDTTGVSVVIVNWPVAHEPVGDCYNVRYTDAAVEEYNRWLREQARTHALPYLDLHDLLPPDDFVDSLHVTAGGHRKIAEQLRAFLDPILVTLSQSKNHRAAH
jgi:hypothetical protein